jgi:hypothetical protein
VVGKCKAFGIITSTLNEAITLLEQLRYIWHANIGRHLLNDT